VEGYIDAVDIGRISGTKRDADDIGRSRVIVDIAVPGRETGRDSSCATR
jgi:hypothetical protein